MRRASLVPYRRFHREAARTHFPYAWARGAHSEKSFALICPGFIEPSQRRVAEIMQAERNDILHSNQGPIVLRVDRVNGVILSVAHLRRHGPRPRQAPQHRIRQNCARGKQLRALNEASLGRSRTLPAGAFKSMPSRCRRHQVRF
jgi:hypothetical protein